MAWARKYPQVGQSIDAVATLVAQMRGLEHAELEARLGRRDERGFVAGVERADIDRVLEMFQESSHVTGDEVWREEQDFFFRAGDELLRTRVRYDAEAMQVQAQTIVKQRVGVRDCFAAGSAGESGCEVRVAVKTETPIARVDSCVRTECVRIKQRRRFVTRCGRWAFDFGMVWSGATKSEAERKQAAEDPVFEIECELLAVDEMLATRDDATIAASLLLKMHDLLHPSSLILCPRHGA